MSLFTSILALPQRLIDAVVAIPEAIKANTAQVKRIADVLEAEATVTEIPDSLGDAVDAAGAALDQSNAALGGAVTDNS